MLWDLTGFPEWVCALKAGANAYSPIGRGSLLSEQEAAMHAAGGPASAVPAMEETAAAPLDPEFMTEEEQLAWALRDSMADGPPK
mgnify:CR=1 FL=1|jgi:hypothetical protein